MEGEGNIDPCGNQKMQGCDPLSEGMASADSKKNMRSMSRRLQKK